MKTKEYVVTFKTSHQIGPDDWAVANPSLKVTNNTTIGEIKDWFEKLKHNPLMEVKLIEMSEIPQKIKIKL